MSGGIRGEAPRWRKIAARLVLVAGVLAVVALVGPEIPREQTIALRVPKGAPVKSIDLSWTRLGDSAPTAGLTLKFPQGAPERVEHRISLPNGDYVLELALERDFDNAGDSGRETKYHRRVRLEGDVTTIRLRDEP